MKTIIAIVSAFTLAACATPYAPNGLTGGFSDARLDENVFQVSFRGNGFTQPEDAQQMLLLRCAEVSQAAGYRYFVIGQQRDTTRQVTTYTPTQVNSTSTVVGNQVYGSSTVTGGVPSTMSLPSGTATIVGYKERPSAGGLVYDATRVIESLGPKYKR